MDKAQRMWPRDIEYILSGEQIRTYDAHDKRSIGDSRNQEEQVALDIV